MGHPIPVQAQGNDRSLVPLRNGDVLDGLKTSRVGLKYRAEVDEYLANHPDLTSLLEVICAHLRETFGPRAELSLEYYKDPEQHDEYPVLYVRQESYEAGILKQIEAVVAPFMPQLEAASGHLLVTTDFRLPRG